MQRWYAFWNSTKKWVVIAVCVVMAYVALIFARRRRVGRLLNTRAADEAHGEVTALRKVRDQLIIEDKTDGEALRRVDGEIKRNRRAIIEAHEYSEGLTDDEVDAEFARLGY